MSLLLNSTGVESLTDYGVHSYGMNYMIRSSVRVEEVYSIDCYLTGFKSGHCSFKGRFPTAWLNCAKKY